VEERSTASRLYMRDLIGKHNFSEAAVSLIIQDFERFANVNESMLALYDAFQTPLVPGMGQKQLIAAITEVQKEYVNHIVRNERQIAAECK
jgi:hypothetical protein